MCSRPISHCCVCWPPSELPCTAAAAALLGLVVSVASEAPVKLMWPASSCEAHVACEVSIAWREPSVERHCTLCLGCV